jgi:hypothetical protein
MRKHFQYLKYVLIHKYWVFYYSCKFGIPWRGLMHDLSKFSPDEWFPYVNYFYGNKKGRFDEVGKEDDFAVAWQKHQNRNKHHWEHWRDATTHSTIMTDTYIKEMMCDWFAMARSKREDIFVNSILYFEKHEDSLPITQYDNLRIYHCLRNRMFCTMI